MAKAPILAQRNKTLQPDVAETVKNQKSYELPAEYDQTAARLINQEFDRIHERINLVVVEAAALADLSEAYVAGDLGSAANIATAINTTNARINALTEIMRNSGLLRRS